MGYVRHQAEAEAYGKFKGTTVKLENDNPPINLIQTSPTLCRFVVVIKGIFMSFRPTLLN